jgi:tetratricopeptide (TPR) repeat protein
LADSLSWLASAQVQLGKLKQAESLYQRELTLLEKLHEEKPGNVVFTTQLATAWSHQAELKKVQGDQNGARIHIQNALSLWGRAIQQDASNRAWQRNLYVAQLTLFDLEEEHLSQQEAWARLNTLHEKFTALSHLEPKKLNLLSLIADVERRQAAVQLRSSDTHAADAKLESALTTLRQLHAAAPTDQMMRRLLAVALLLDADRNFLRNEKNIAYRSCGEVQTLLRPYLKDSADFHVLAPWVLASACQNDGEHALPMQKQLEAMQYRDPTYLRYLTTHPTKKVSS